MDTPTIQPLGARLHHGVETSLQSVQGVNTKFEYYTVSVGGTQNGNLWVMNLSAQPG